MRGRVNQDVILGALALLFGSFIALYWGPLDSDTGIAEKVRGRWSIGDALAPVVAGFLIAGSGVFIAVGGLLRGAEATISTRNIAYLAAFLAIITAGFLAIRYAGPLAAGALGEEYRLLRDERPWKYVGFIIGGGGMIFGLMSLAEGRVQNIRLALALAIAAGLALIYDLPFEDLLLPPNGDV